MEVPLNPVQTGVVFSLPPKVNTFHKQQIVLLVQSADEYFAEVAVAVAVVDVVLVFAAATVFQVLTYYVQDPPPCFSISHFRYLLPQAKLIVKFLLALRSKESFSQKALMSEFTLEFAACSCPFS